MSHYQQYLVSPQALLGEMAPWTAGLVLDVALVDERLDVNHSMGHPTAGYTPPSSSPTSPAHSTHRGVQLGKRMLSMAPNEGVPIVVFGLCLRM